VIEDERSSGEAGCGGGEHGVDRGIIGDHDVRAVGAAHGLSGTSDRRRADLREGLRLIGRAIPYTDGLASLAERTREPGAQKTGAENRDHAEQRTASARSVTLVSG